jgi:aryl-alcohol dehydrogenase-like predicted oxidoreductase
MTPSTAETRATPATLAGRPVARIGYGAMQLTHGGHVAPADARAVLRRAVESGANHLDTAQFYGAGACNTLIREALAPYPDTLVLATKIGADNPAGDVNALVAAQRPAELRAQVEQNLHALGVDRLDLVYLRRLDGPPGIIAEGAQTVDLDEQLAELTKLREEGKIGAIGLSNVGAERLRRALPAGIEAVQNWYSVLSRDEEPVLEACRENGIAWVPYCPLGSAFPGRPKAWQDPEIVAVARQLGATPAQVALAWLLRHYARTLLIPGTADPGHLAENLAAADLELPGEAVARLGRIGAGPLGGG